jgi:hypothetical protein
MEMAPSSSVLVFWEAGIYLFFRRKLYLSFSASCNGELTAEAQVSCSGIPEVLKLVDVLKIFSQFCRL